nr:hypothetical protein [Tanacetum cinerariifolium]
MDLQFPDSELTYVAVEGLSTSVFLLELFANAGQKMQRRDDMPLLRTIADIFGQPIWFKATVVLNHVASAPLEDPKDHEKRGSYDYRDMYQKL